MKDKYGRTYKDIKNHYDVEKQIANKLKKSTREERTEIYRNMYNELFSKVPNHPRLLKRNNEEERKKSINNKLTFLLEFINNDDTFLEVGPGDCRLAFEVCNYAQYVYGLDISDQIGDYPKENIPDNFELLIYDGYNLNMDDEKIDVSYSDQMIEHLHPDDIELHFQMINRILKPNGCYILETPHNYKGPHDVSKWFSEVPEGFHLKEYTYKEIINILKNTGFSNWKCYRLIKGYNIKTPTSIVTFMEKIMNPLPKKIKKRVSSLLFPNIVIVAYK